MTTIAASWVNIAAADLATLTSTTAATAMPITTLQQEDVLRCWRGTGGAGVAESIYFDLGSTQSVTVVALLNTNLVAADTTRLRLSVADPTCVTNTYDSTSAANRVDPIYKDLIFLASPASSPRYGRIDLTCAAESPEAGFLHVGTYTQFAYNYAHGAQCTRVDPSIPKKTKGGQTKIMRRTQFRRWDIPIEVVTEAQRWSVVEGIDYLNGISSPVLFILDPTSTNLGRDSIFGLIQESSPVVSIEGYVDGAPVYSKSYRIDQRR